MNKVIAVDDGLTPVKNFLAAKGCQVIDVEAAKQQQVSAIILSGMDENFLGIQDVIIDAPVITAKGMSPEQVWNSILEKEKQGLNS